MKGIALTHQLENMTRTGVTEMASGLGEYMRVIIEGLIVQSRAARNTGFLANKESEIGDEVINLYTSNIF